MITALTFEELLDALPFHCRALIVDLKTLRERPDFHPEESAFEHVRIVTERALSLGNSYEFKKELIIAGLFHDIGKKVTAKPNEKLREKFGFTPPTSPGHDKFGSQLVKGNAMWIKSVGASPEIVEYICHQHMRIAQFGSMKNKKRSAFMKDTYFRELCVFHQMDNMLENFSSDSMYNVYNKYKEIHYENNSA